MCETIVLITPPTISHRTAEETLALGYLATVLRSAKYEARIIDSWVEGLDADAALKEIEALGRPAMVGMSCYRSNLEQASNLLRSLRMRFGSDLPAFCGGYGPTFQPEDFLNEGFDVAVIGEAEHIIVSLVNVLKARDTQSLAAVPGVVFLRDGRVVKTSPAAPMVNLDQVAFPARDTIASVMRQGSFVNLCTSRGCMAACTFCSVFAFALLGHKDLRWRGRSIGSIVDEVAFLYERYGVRHIKFVDDSFVEPPRDALWADRFANELARRGLSIRFRTQVRADRLTEPLVEALGNAGWFATSVGVENASPTALKRMNKDATYADNVRAVELLERHGIYVQMGMILFDPYTTVQELRENLRFLQGTQWPVNKGIFTEMYAAEGSAFTKTLRKRGELSPDSEHQNHAYMVHESHAARVYALLKRWHRSHSRVYDWVIDSISAPKVLPDDGYRAVHALCRQLWSLDVRFFEEVLDHVQETTSTEDDAFIGRQIQNSIGTYGGVEVSISALYSRYGLRYDAAPNPFLTRKGEKQ